jgi:hypothetical protein
MLLPPGLDIEPLKVYPSQLWVWTLVWWEQFRVMVSVSFSCTCMVLWFAATGLQWTVQCSLSAWQLVSAPGRHSRCNASSIQKSMRKSTEHFFWNSFLCVKALSMCCNEKNFKHASQWLHCGACSFLFPFHSRPAVGRTVQSPLRVRIAWNEKPKRRTIQCSAVSITRAELLISINCSFF